MHNLYSIFQYIQKENGILQFIFLIEKNFFFQWKKYFIKNFQISIYSYV